MNASYSIHPHEKYSVVLIDNPHLKDQDLLKFATHICRKEAIPLEKLEKSAWIERQNFSRLSEGESFYLHTFSFYENENPKARNLLGSCLTQPLTEKQKDRLVSGDVSVFKELHSHDLSRPNLLIGQTLCGDPEKAKTFRATPYPQVAEYTTREFPAGTYLLCDPCYLEEAPQPIAFIYTDSDGSIFDNQGRQFFVDSGRIGIYPGTTDPPSHPSQGWHRISMQRKWRLSKMPTHPTLRYRT